jgi:heme-degrading monooxygenase HmoA
MAIVTILLVERYPVAADKTDEFEALLDGYLRAVREQDGALWADGGSGDADGYLVVSEWRTAEALDAWQGADALRGWDDAADPLLVGDVSRRRFAPAG